MIPVHISPSYLGKKDTGDGGIRRVSEAMLKYLPEFGIEHTEAYDRAQVVINQGGDNVWKKGVPSVNCNHGLYWSRQPWEDNFQQVNQQVVESMVRAVAHTAPSEWVARAIRRGGYIYPEVVYHGIDAENFQPAESSGDFVLWNKARTDYVSNPDDLNQIAYDMPDRKFITTFGHERPNVKVLSGKPFGNMAPTDYEGMKKLVAQAGVYLCTARETFGIGTLEAMAYGVPIAGWDWGGQSEIIVQGETGYLAPPGDYKVLRECIERCFQQRDRLSANCVSDVRTRWGWKPRIQQYADIIHRVYEEFYITKRPRVSVIVTAYKLDRYLPECLKSVQSQSFTDWECLVIDDANSEITGHIVSNFMETDKRFRYKSTVQNMGLSGARNYGFSLAQGRYIRHVDADDFLADNALALEVTALDDDPGVHIVYGHLGTTTEDGKIEQDRFGAPARGGWPPEKFNWVEQMAHLNQLPSCVMMRREVLERSGGYRTRMKRQEDAEFWCRVTSLGFRAKKFTQAITYYHRMRDNSKGALEWKEEGAEPDWTVWFPWRVGAGNYQDGIRILRKYAGLHPKPHLVPFFAQGRAPNTRFWYVHDHAYPVVSVIVTVGPGHREYLVDALDSLWAQSYPDWECVVVDDDGRMKAEGGRMKEIPGFPWAKVVSTGGNLGASAARNEGYKHARGKYIVWMDADDIWLPWFLETMVAQAEKNDGVIYSDLVMDKDGAKSVYRYREFTPEILPGHMHYPGSSVLIPRKIVEAVKQSQGGWDLTIPGMEDWDYQMAVHAQGFCAYHVEEPLFIYRMHTSTKRESDYAKIDSIMQYMDNKWHKYRVQGVKMSCGCAGKKIVKTSPASTLSGSGNFRLSDGVEQEDIKRQLVVVEYLGPHEGTFTLKSMVDTQVKYRFGNNPHNKERPVYLADAERFISMTDSNGVPLYRILNQTSLLEEHNLAAFVGGPLAVEA